MDKNGKLMALCSTEKRNWLIHLLFLRQDYSECLKMIETLSKVSSEKSEFLIFMKGLIFRTQGKIQESLELFKQCHILNPNNLPCQKEIAKALYLLGKHHSAIEVYEASLTISPSDWQLHYGKAQCYVALRNFEEAVSAAKKALQFHKHELVYELLARIYTIQEDYTHAIEVYLEALESTPENPELLSAIGSLYIRLGDNDTAFQYIGNALSFDPKYTKAILAIGSITQDRGDPDAAMLKYRIAAIYNPNSAQLWNNIGMCFFGKQKYVAAIACLKRAQYLNPFEWTISFNLGLVHLSTAQYASAFQYFSASLHLNPDFASTYMYLGIALNRLGDFKNACAAFQKSINLKKDHTAYFNFAIVMFNQGQKEDALELFKQGEQLFQKLDEEARQAKPELLDQRGVLAQTLGVQLSK